MIAAVVSLAGGCDPATAASDAAPPHDTRFVPQFRDAPLGTPCQSPTDCDDQNPCTQDLCSAGWCDNPPDPAATCSDGDSCTSGDHCANGVCQPGTPIPNGQPCEGQTGFCGPSGCLECQLDTNCPEKDGDPCTVPSCAQGGFCAEIPGNENGACSDGDPCTDNDTCTAGKCAGTTKDCSLPPDQCHGPGSCNAGTGACDYPVLGGSACNDGDSCTAGDYCNAQGACVGVAQTGWQRKITIDYQQNDPDGKWATEQTGSYTVDGKITDVRVSGSSDDGGYCYAYWGTGHIARYTHPGSFGLYNVNGVYYTGLSGICPTYPPSFDDQGTVKICQGTSGAGAFAYGQGNAGSALPMGTKIDVKARHAIGNGSDAIHCYLDVLCP